MKKCLALIGGVSDHDYMLDNLVQCKSLWRKLLAKYGREHIYNVRYQDIMDKHALLMKSVLDPVRLMLTPNGWAAERHVDSFLKDLEGKYDEVDVITHSQGSWMVLKADVKLNKLWNIANPIGWFAPLARTMVRLNIGKPKVKVKELFYIYSSEDFVSKKPPRIKGKWTLDATKIHTIDAKTIHDAKKYFIKIDSFYPQVFD